MRTYRTRYAVTAFASVAALLVAGCSNSDGPPTPESLSSPVVTATDPGPSENPEPTEDPEPTKDPVPTEEPVDPAAEQAKIEALIDELFDESDEGVGIDRGLEEQSFGDEYIDETTGEKFDDTRLARVYTSYASPDWEPGGGSQYLVWFEIVRLDSTARVDRYANMVAAEPDHEQVVVDSDFGSSTLEFIPDLPGPRPGFSSSSIVRGLRVVWPGGIRTEGVAVVDTAGPYALTLYSVAMPNESSIDGLYEVLEEIAQPLTDGLVSLRDS